MTDIMIKIYSFDESINDQMLRLKSLRESDPQSARKMIEKGESMLEYAKSGSFRKLSIFTSISVKKDILYYYVILSFKECLKNGHFMMTDHLIEHGFPLADRALPPILIDIIPELQDYQGVNIVNYLATKEYDFNMQAPGQWLTAIHVATKHTLIETVKALISHGADVNAVAKDDLMPLIIAESIDDESIRSTLTSVLVSHGAVNTWRRRTNVEASVVKGSVNTMVSFRGGVSSVTITSSDDASIAVSTEENGNSSRETNEGSSNMSIAISDDGGMMFSTT